MKYVSDITIPPYRLRIEGPDTLDDVVPSEKFLREFPSGVVPITHTEHLYWRRSNHDDQWLALVDTVAIYDRGRKLFGKIDAEYVAALLRDFRLLREQSNDQTLRELPGLYRDSFGKAEEVPSKTDPKRMEHLVRQLAETGLKLTPLRKFVGVVSLYGAFPGWRRYSWSTWQHVDRRVLKGECYADVSKDLGLSINLVRSWAITRGFPVQEATDECTYWWLRQVPPLGSKVPDRVGLLAAMRKKYPWCHFETATCSERAKRVKDGKDPEPQWKDTWTTPM